MDLNSPEELAAAGQAAYKSGDYPAARQAFEAASNGYAARGEAEMAAEMDNNLCVTLLAMGEAQAAYEAALDTPEVFEASGDIRRQAMATGNLAAAQEALGQLKEAEAKYRRSADLLAQIGEDELRANVMQSISKLQLRDGRQMEALASMQEGIGGLKHPSLRQRLLKKLLRTPFKFLHRS